MVVYVRSRRPMPRICILVLSGLPASGKSTCARRLTSSANGPGAGLRFFHVAYDEIMPSDVEEKLLEPSSNCLRPGVGEQEPSQWKNYRKEIVKCVGKHIVQHALREGSRACEEKGQESPATGIWERFFKSVERGNAQSVPGGCKMEDVCVDDVYIIDDNMYYQSMRYEYYQLARKYNAGFAQVYFDSSEEMAQKRNSLRASPVPPSVIAAMADRLEPPGSAEPCDKHVMVVCTDQNTDDYVPDVLRLVATAVVDPVPAMEVPDEGALEDARVACSTNLIHQSDQALRQLIANTMAQAKVDGLEKAALRDLAAKMNGVRQRLLRDMRQGRLLVESGLNQEAHVGRLADSTLYKFVKTVLANELERTES